MSVGEAHGDADATPTSEVGAGLTCVVDTRAKVTLPTASAIMAKV